MNVISLVTGIASVYYDTLAVSGYLKRKCEDVCLEDKPGRFGVKVDFVGDLSVSVVFLDSVVDEITVVKNGLMLCYLKSL